MRRQFYTPQTVRAQRRNLRRKRLWLAAATAAFVLLTAAVCLLQSRRTQFAAVAVNGLASFAYLAWLLYFFSYDYKKEKVYARLAEQLLQGESSPVAGTVTGCVLAEDSLEPVYRLELEPEEGGTARRYSLSPRAGFDPAPLAGRRAVLYVCAGHVTGVEAEP